MVKPQYFALQLSDAPMHRILANASRLLSRMTGGAENTTLCHRAAMRWVQS